MSEQEQTTNESRLDASFDAPLENPPQYIVGVGASAGGLEAIEEFFSHMPANSGLGFVVLQHLSPDYKSLMVELLSKKTEMPVFRAEEGMAVEANCVYLIPPRKNLTIFHGRLLLSEQDHSHGLNLPIDIFLRSLAEDQGEKAIGIILSGTGSDGTRGTRAVKECGGMVMAQDEDSAKFDGMPKSVAATGLTDFILPPAELAQQLVAYAQGHRSGAAQLPDALLTDEDSLTRIFALLRSRHKVDFTYYKPSTVVRRIERRMTVNQMHHLDDYVRYLESYPREVTSLYRELLIGVTSFLRDPEAWQVLGDEFLPKFLRPGVQQPVRFWVAGCSTGEEAYSLAILCQECLAKISDPPAVKIFATDIDSDAIMQAGNGVYPESIAADLSPKLLSRYFLRRDDAFQVSRKVREMVVFAQHNLVTDPPFTNIDLVSCRNLLIYLQPVLQKKALEFFNFSLNPNGVLFLGSSETTGEMSEYFESAHKKWKIYRCKGKRANTGVTPALMSSGHEKLYNRRHRMPIGHHVHQEEERVLERFLDAVSNDYVPLALVINEQMELLHVVGDATGFLRFPPGRMLNDVTRIAAKDLAIPLVTGIKKVFKTPEEIKYTHVRVQHMNETKVVTVRIKQLPGKKGQEMLAVVFIEEVAVKESQTQEQASTTYDIDREAEQRIHDLEQELQFSRENLQATIEELETSNEELQATNEELLASNEELQSTNEELQSVNEELYTVNAEYQRKIMELTELNNDVENLLASTQVGTLFLDENLEIRKFTPQITHIYKIMSSDIGRSLSDLSHQLINIDPLDIVKEVQATNRLSEVEAQAANGRWYLLRALPYHVAPQTFSGAVITFIDITKLKQTRDRLAESEERFRSAFEQAAVGMAYVDTDGRFERVNEKLCDILGFTRREMMRINHDELVHPDDLQNCRARLKELLSDGDQTFAIDLRYRMREGGYIWMYVTVSGLRKENDSINQFIFVMEDISQRKEAESKIADLARFPSENPNPVMRFSQDGVLRYANPAAKKLLNVWQCQVGDRVVEPWNARIREVFAQGKPQVFEQPCGDCLYALSFAPVVEEGYLNIYGLDITMRQQAREQAELAREQWQRTFDAIPDLVAVVDHECKIIHVNRALANHLGKNPHECVGQPCAWCDNLDGQANCEFRQAMEAGQTELLRNSQEFKRNGFRVFMCPMEDDEGNLQGWVHVARRAETQE